MYRVEAHFTVTAPVAAVWNCLTAYDHIAKMLPSVEESRLLRVEGDSVKRVFQRIRLRLVLIPVSVQWELRVREYPYAAIEFEESRQAYFRVYRGRWELLPVTAGVTQVRYIAEFSPQPLLKPLIHRAPARFIESFLTEVRTALQRNCRR
jgi:ribosome-associated toxin RatA of RatAB toxin-antitoxin module